MIPAFCTFMLISGVRIPTEMQKDFEILPRTLGKGRFLGANLGMQGNRKLYFDKWWGEGEVKVYLDGDREWPTLAGTGSEDYAGTGWAVQKPIL